MDERLEAGHGVTRANGRLPSPHWIALTGLAAALSSWGAVELTRDSGPVPTIWVANAIVLAIMLGAKRAAWPALLASACLGNVASDILAGDAIPLAFGTAGCNLVEIILAAGALRLRHADGFDLSRSAHLATFVACAGLLAPVLTGVLATNLLAHSAPDSFGIVWRTWCVSHALGFLIVTPLLMNFRVDQARMLLAPERRLETCLWLLALIATLALAFGQSRYPLVFLPVAIVGLGAVRLGAAGAIIGTAMTAVVAVTATFLGHGPLMLMPADLATRLFLVQSILAAVVLTTLPLSALLAERSRLSADLLRSETFLRGVIDGSGDSIEVLDPAGNLRFISRTGLRLMDIDDPGAVLGTPFAEMWPEETRTEVAAMLHVARSGTPASLTAPIATAKGRLLHVDVLVTPILNRDGAPESLVAIARDISHLYEAEAVAREKSLLLETILETMDQGLVMIDPRGRVPIVNRRARELLELPSDLPDYRTVRTHMHKAERWGDRSQTPPQWLMSADGQSTDVRYERRSAEGHVLEVRAMPMHGGGVVQTFTDITHLKQAEDAAREAEALFHGLFDHVTDLQFVHQIGPDGSIRLETCNPPAAAMLGLPVEALRGNALEDLLAPEAAARARRDIETTVALGVPRRVVDEQAPALGESVWEIVHVPLRDAATGRISRVFASARDITHLRSAEIAARDANRRLLLAEQVARIGHWHIALPAQTLAWSDGVFRMHGVDRDGFDPTVRTAIGAYHPDDRETLTRVVANAIERGESFEVSARLLRADGLVRDVVARGLCEFDAHGGVTAVFGTIMDVTDLREAERAVAQSEARYRLLADNTTDMVSHMDLTGRRLFVSPGSRDLLGYEPHELVGTSPHDMMHPDDAGSVAAVFADLAAGRTDRAVTVNRLRHKNGTWIWVEASLRLLRDEKHEPQSFVAAIRDVTERQQQADQLRAAKEIAEFAKARADHASQAKTDFLAAMSHEIRTPLNSIIGFTDLMLDVAALPPEVRRHAELIQSSGSALLTIVNDILDFSKVEAGAITLETHPFSPRALVDNCVSILRAAAEAKQLDLRANIDPGLPLGLTGDEARLRQVLLNLLNNAVKFTRRGGVTLSVRFESSTPQGERIRFAVTDTGIGIPKDKHSLLFRRFSQIDGSIQRDFGGTGLGLAICKRLIELMGGEIGVLSDDSQGSTFWFTVTLPRGRVDAVLAQARTLSRLRKRGRLLLVEDVAINQELGRVVLETAGHEVDIVSDGAAAVMAVQDAAVPYDLVLMDVQMPGMDGMTATRLIRRCHTLRRSTPIIAMTANVLPEQVREFEAAGMDDHVGKPFNRAELYATIDRWLPESVSEITTFSDRAFGS